MNDLIKLAQAAFIEEVPARPDFKSGDTITVISKITEGTKERLQSFRGVVIQRRGEGLTETVTVRKVTDGIGIERIFPIFLPSIVSIEINKYGMVRRARIFYQRDLTGKKARIKERKSNRPDKKK